MATTCYDIPTEAGSSPQAPLGGPCAAPRQAPLLTAVGFLYDSSSNRTFRIPDVPATSTILHVKQWYSKHVAPQGDTRQLAVLHNNMQLEDYTQVWQLAQGQGQFAVVVSPVSSPRSTLNLFVDTPLPRPPFSLRLSSDSTILYAKQRLLELLDLPMALSSSPSTTLIMPPATSPLTNEHTLEQCGLIDGSRLSLCLPPTQLPNVPVQPLQPQSQQFPSSQSTPVYPTASPAANHSQYQSIAEIWGNGNDSSSTRCSPVNNGNQASRSPSGHLGHALLPAALLEDDDDDATPALVQAPRRGRNNKQGGGNSRRNKDRRSHSPPTVDSLSQDQLQHLAANFRTKLCRNGHGCKFGRHCWFAHTSEELRKPADPLPNNLPAVHKLERYSHREGKERQAL